MFVNTPLQWLYVVISTSLFYDDNPYVDDENGDIVDENENDTCNDDAGSIWLVTMLSLIHI